MPLKWLVYQLKHVVQVARRIIQFLINSAKSYFPTVMAGLGCTC
jgi:hypothetical protein